MVRKCFYMCEMSWILLGSSLLFSIALGLKPEVNREDVRPLCECGSIARPLQTRVVGGKKAPSGEFPYATGLLTTYGMAFSRQFLGTTDFTPYCGATLISDRHVLTAAHCVRGRKASDITLDIGEYDVQDDQERRTIRAASILKKHPEYVSSTFNNDIAVIEFSKPVKLGGNVKAAWLPPQDVSFIPGTPVTVYGWGRLKYGGGRPKVLQMLQIPVVSTSECQKKLITDITPSMLCAGGQEGKDACVGDSGSGLTVQRKAENVLVGVVSFGRKCALPGVAGVYTKVSNFVDWIYENTRSAGCRPCIAALEDFA